MTDRKSFEQSALAELDSVYRAAYALCGAGPEAEDLVQATFLKALENYRSFRPGTSCRAWMLRILRNTWIDELRHRKVTGTAVPVEEALIASRPEARQTTWNNARDLLENFSDQQVIKALGELSDEHRLTLFLVDVQEMGHEEAAEILGVAPGTIKSRASRARAILKAKLQAHAEKMGLTGRKR